MEGSTTTLVHGIAHKTICYNTRQTSHSHRSTLHSEMAHITFGIELQFYRIASSQFATHFSHLSVLYC